MLIVFLKKIIIPSLFCSLLFANELDLLQKDKKELRQIEKEVIQKKRMKRYYKKTNKTL